MAPIKFEDDLKKKLEQRKLQPSANVWNKLEKRLEAEDNKKSNKGFWWFGIAASFVGILIVTSIFFNRENIKEIDPIIVDVEAVEEPSSTVVAPTSNKIEEKDVIEQVREKGAVKTKKNTPNKTSELKTQIQQKQKALITPEKH